MAFMKSSREILLWAFMLLASMKPVASFVRSFTPSSVGFCPRKNGFGPTRSRLCSKEGNEVADDSEALDSLKSLVDFHEGTWKGKARSFTVTADVAAGIVRRKTSPEYQVSVKFGLDIRKRDYTLTEAMEWGVDDNKQVLSRKLSLTDCSMDVDAVDATYSLDATLPDFPSALSGTSELTQFMVEHCISTSHDSRQRCLAFYGGSDQRLMRVVICEEDRSKDDGNATETHTMSSASLDQTATMTTEDILEMQGDIDRLVDRISGKVENQGNSSPSGPLSENDRSERLGKLANRANESSDGSLVPHPITLLEISSGIWLGDTIIRDMPMVEMAPKETGKGFGTKPVSNRKVKIPFASWSVGVQKIASRWMWNFGEEIRQTHDAGKSMGAQIATSLIRNLGGSVCVNEGLSRRIPKSERMVYIDWEGEQVGFLSGSVYIQLPRYLDFDPKANSRPFSTEFCVYQKEKPAVIDVSPDGESALPNIICSKSTRIYNHEGMLKQGGSSFFTLKRFGVEGDDE